MKRKQSRWKPGMTYAVPLVDGSFGIAQAGETMGRFVNVTHVAMFSYRFTDLPKTYSLQADAAVSLASTWKRGLNRGDWSSLEQRVEVFRKSDFPNERFAESRYVGARTYDAGILADFLSAYHGLVPWNVMHDPDYYEHLLRPEMTRPKAAIILDKAAREKYRRETLGVDA